jgi:heme oxygenase (mycobilin-producing)
MTSSTSEQPFVFINPIEVPPDQVDSFLDGWRGRADFMRHQAGFRDYRLMRALLPNTRFPVVAVARWDSQEAFAEATADPTFRAQLQALMDDPDVDAKGNPALYRVALEASAAQSGADK